MRRHEQREKVLGNAACVNAETEVAFTQAL